MTSIADSSVKIQTTPEPNPSTPCWFGEVVVISSALRKHHILSKINERVCFARKRFGRYEVIDFLAVLFGYAISGERTLEEFYPRLMTFLRPFAGWMTSVPLATEAANAERLSGHAQRFHRRIVISGSAVSGTEGTGGIEKNCARRSRLLAAIWLPISSHKNARCSGWMGNMALGRCSLLSRASRLSPAAKNTACSTIRSFRLGCTCPPIRSSSVPKVR